MVDLAYGLTLLLALGPSVLPPPSLPNPPLSPRRPQLTNPPSLPLDRIVLGSFASLRVRPSVRSSRPASPRPPAQLWTEGRRQHGEGGD